MPALLFFCPAVIFFARYTFVVNKRSLNYI